MSSRTLAQHLVERLIAMGLRITTVESCTGGLVAGAITAISGSSAVFDYGFVTYSNGAKTALVGVPEGLLAAYGAVSLEVADCMAEGALQASGANIALSITGIAGPGGGTIEKPIGMVCFGLSYRDASGQVTTQAQVRQFGDIGRDQVRERSVAFALGWAIETIGA